MNKYLLILISIYLLTVSVSISYENSHFIINSSECFGDPDTAASVSPALNKPVIDNSIKVFATAIRESSEFKPDLLNTPDCARAVKAFGDYLAAAISINKELKKDLITPPVGTKLLLCSSESNDPVFAVSNGKCTEIHLLNTSGTPRSAGIGVELPSGVYLVERQSLLTDFTSGSNKKYLRNIVNKSARCVWMETALEAKSGCVICISEKLNSTLTRLYELKDMMTNNGSSDTGWMKRLIYTLNDSIKRMNSLQTGSSNMPRIIHRVLLNIAQIEATVGNYAEKEDGVKFQSIRDKNRDIQADLSQLSAVTLGIGINTEIGAGKPGDTVPMKLTISNSGARAVYRMKYNLTIPEGVSVDPDTDGILGNLAPGEVVTAEFKVKLPDKFDSKSEISGDICYFLYTAAAHLPVSIKCILPN